MKRGFTVVEIVVVILVIGLLVGITAVVYRSARDESVDTARRAAAQQVVAAMEALKFQKNEIKVGGANSNASLTIDANGVCRYDGQGWLYRTTGSYPCTMGEMLLKAGLLLADFFEIIPPNNGSIAGDDNRRESAMMLYRCNTSQRTYLLYYYLQNPTQEETDNLANLRSSCPNNNFSDTLVERYAMRAAVEVKL